jgi:hypothetical protein
VVLLVIFLPPPALIDEVVRFEARRTSAEVRAGRQSMILQRDHSHDDTFYRYNQMQLLDLSNAEYIMAVMMLAFTNIQN